MKGENEGMSCGQQAVGERCPTPGSFQAAKLGCMEAQSTSCDSLPASHPTEFCGTIDADAKRMARALNFGWANH